MIVMMQLNNSIAIGLRPVIGEVTWVLAYCCQVSSHSCPNFGHLNCSTFLPARNQSNIDALAQRYKVSAYLLDVGTKALACFSSHQERHRMNDSQMPPM